MCYQVLFAVNDKVARYLDRCLKTVPLKQFCKASTTRLHLLLLLHGSLSMFGLDMADKKGV